MPLQLRELLTDPSLGLALVAGAGGLDERGPVRWAHISEIPDPTPWLEGGEILLTTGLGVRDSDALQRRLVAGLGDRGCPGVGFGLGVVLDAVPSAMLDEANRRRLPLFTVPYEVPFIAVTKRVSRHIFDEHYATLRTAVDLHRSVLSAVLSGAGVRSVLDTVARQMPGFGAVLFDYYGQVLARRSVAGANLPDSHALWTLMGGARQPRDRFVVAADAHDAVVSGALIRLGDQVEGVLALVGDREPADHELLLLEQAVTGVSLELARDVSLREAHRARVDDLLDEVAHNRIGHRALQRQLSRLGAEPERPYRVLCLRSEQPGVSLRALSDLVEDALTTSGSAPVLGRHEGDVYCLTQPLDGAHADRVAAALQARGWSRVAIGRSRPKDDIEALDAALREAAVATRAGRNGAAVGDVAQLGLTGMLAGLDAALVAEAFVTPVLGPLLDYDDGEGAALVASLRAYLAHGCRPGPAAAELGVHRHTLAYRLDRIATLTGRDLRDGRHLLEFGLALELHDRGS